MNSKEIFIGAYAPGRTALIIHCIGDDEKSVINQIGSIIREHRGQMFSVNEMSEVFSKYLSISIAKNQINTQELLTAILAANIDSPEILTHSKQHEIICQEKDSANLFEALESRGLIINSAQTRFRPVFLRLIQNISSNEIADFLSLIKSLGGLSVVKKVWTNLDVPIEDVY